MKELPREAGHYITGRYIKEIHFPNGDVCCGYCPFLQRMRRRNICNKTGEEITASNLSIGLECPLEFETGEE